VRRLPGLLPLLLPVVLLGGCSLFRLGPATPPLQEQVHYVLERPYQQGGVWRYPRAEYGVDQTGLATIAPDHKGLTADGEIFDQTALAAGHRTLQLPAIVRVTNLENGRVIAVRLNDRGPPAPGRLIVLTRRAAQLLEMHGDGTRVRVQMQDTETRQLAAELQSEGPALDVAPVPRAAVASESLAPPGGATQSGRVRVASIRPVPLPSTGGSAPPIPLRLPEAVSQGYANPGMLYIDAGAFSRQDYASILVNKLSFLGARLTTSYNAPRDQAYRIRIGPFSTVAEAEAMLDRAISAGVNDAAIVVE
jgi:rare lipoprotein A